MAPPADYAAEVLLPTLAVLYGLRHAAVPMGRMGPVVTIACARPDRIDALRADLPPGFPPVLPVVAPQAYLGRPSSASTVGSVTAVLRRSTSSTTCR